jgi:hypothetical protein
VTKSAPETFWMNINEPVGIVGSMLPDSTAAMGRLVPDTVLVITVKPATSATKRIRSSR